MMVVVVSVLFVGCGRCAKFCDCFCVFGGDEILVLFERKKCNSNETLMHFAYAVLYVST